MKSFKVAAALCIASLMTGAGFGASAAGYNPCSACYTKFLQCRRNGANFYQCYADYEDCLARNNCPIP
jgi:hypothetical protein